MTSLSVVIPAFNEAPTLEEIVRRVLAVDLEGVDREVIIVNDGSTDATPELGSRLAQEHPGTVRYLALPRRSGKGAAVRQGLAVARGEILIIQDGDLEYDPRDFRRILAAYEGPQVEVVFGSRLLASNPIGYRPYYWGGRLVTAVTNLLFGSALTDQPTCYKSLRAPVLRSLTLRCDGFEFCAELTAKLLRSGHRIQEVPISYRPRRFREGKKLRPLHAARILWTLLRLRFGGR